jgi:phosphoserine phosphatase RsbU/P
MVSSENLLSGRLNVPRPLLIAAALVFAAITAFYSVLWMRDAQYPSNQVEIGFNAGRDTRLDPVTKCIQVYNVIPDSPAENSGMRAGDRIIALNNRPLTTFLPFQEIWNRSKPGDTVQVTVSRNGVDQPLDFYPRFRLVSQSGPVENLAEVSARKATSLFPVFFLLVGFAVLLLRLDNATAWLLALLFACFIAAPGLTNPAYLSKPQLIFASVFRSLCNGFLPTMFYCFFALFPERSWVERKLPWLKWFAVAFGMSVAIPGLRIGDPHWPEFFSNLLGDPFANYVRLTINYGLIALGIISLLSNAFGRNVSADARRKSRVMLGGTLVGIVPIAAYRLVADFTGYQGSFWMGTITILLLLLYPLSFAYAVVKHRVLEIPALLRRSARYVLVQRGFFVLIVAAALAAIYLFTHFFSGVFGSNPKMGMGLSAVFGVALVWISAPIVKRGTVRIDRAFFRSSYDARVVLQDLLEKMRTVSDRNELAKLIEEHLTQALHPQSLAFYCEAADGKFVAVNSSIPPEIVAVDADTPFLREIAAHGRVWDVPQVDSPRYRKPSPFSALAPECLVPLLARDAHLVGLLVLGQPLSEEPYSQEDKRLLESVAVQAAAALENIRLAEHIADRIEVERRAAHEIEIARDVQSRLFPQAAPPLSTLEYAGSCIQARQVGGDYYDFLDLGSSRVAFVLADISGKGIAGALLMANLQANLRSRYAVAFDDLPRLLRSVNQLFLENSPEDRYATLFLAVYDDKTRRLTYANCGHNPPLLLRTSGTVEGLTPTASVIGLFPAWHCETRVCELAAGDVLVIYTDGVTEAENASGCEFGEQRLIETLRANSGAHPSELLARIQEAVQKFSAGEQSDDLTLVVARVR